VTGKPTIYQVGKDNQKVAVGEAVVPAPTIQQTLAEKIAKQQGGGAKTAPASPRLSGGAITPYLPPANPAKKTPSTSGW
jgi:hypothetical protein